MSNSPYKDFTARLKLLISKNPHLVTTTLSNIFTMRLIGNKLFSHALVATSKGHEAAMEKLNQDIEEQKKRSKLA